MLTTQINKIKNSSLPALLLGSMAPLCFFYALYLAAKYAEQLPLDLYAFRQSQTALTAYWLIKNGFSLAYETPVGGPPWSIPFEFPIYQYIVALISGTTGWSMIATGRMLSFAFLALCAFPVRSIMRDLKISGSAYLVFTALLFSSPFYLYWGRTFMIETAALFFTVASLKYFVDIVQSRNSYTNQLLFVLCMTLGILQKATTGLPVLAVTCGIYLFSSLKAAPPVRAFVLEICRKMGMVKGRRDDGPKLGAEGCDHATAVVPQPLRKKLVSALIYFGVPLAIGVAWTEYTDYIKGFNQLGIELTSSALANWNWGTWSQRFSAQLYQDVIWQRIFRDNLCGFLGIIILIAAFFSKAQKDIKFIIFISLILGILPLYLFTNLHLIHKYYQSSSLIFFLFALAVSIGHILDGTFAKKTAAFILTLIFVCFHVVDFSINYRVIETVYGYTNSLPFAISQVLKKDVPEDKYFVAFGNDWSSTLSYLSERKSFTVPIWFKKYDKIALNPENFVPENQLGAVVLCPFVKSPTINGLIGWSNAGRRWKIGQVHECYIATPEVPLQVTTANASTSNCRGGIEFAGERQVGNEKVFSIAGWTAIARESTVGSTNVYIAVTRKGDQPKYFEAQQIDNVGAAPVSANAKDVYRGFSRVLSAEMPVGEYEVKIARMSNGRLEMCQ